MLKPTFISLAFGALVLVSVTCLASCDFVLDVTCGPENPSAAEDPDCVRSNGLTVPRIRCEPILDTPIQRPTWDEVATILLAPDRGDCSSREAQCHVPGSSRLSGDLIIPDESPEALYEFLITTRGLRGTSPYVVPGPDSRSSWMHCNVSPFEDNRVDSTLMPWLRQLDTYNPNGGLSPADYRVIEDWILTGAPGPGDSPSPPSGDGGGGSP
ncbi:MAG: hypothetical protein AAGA56_11085 [Myxococcota bacterium]